MTGAPIPAGADTVVKVEDTRPVDGGVEILAATPVGTAIRPAGGDLEQGASVFVAGTVLTPAHVGVLATIGVAHPVVYRRPSVAIVSTGDEVLPPDAAELAPGQIRDSNRPLLAALLTELGVDMVDYGIVPDDAEELRQTLLDAARSCDVILTSGGVSMGDYDLVKQILTELGDIDLWKIAMQPAKPFAFGAIEGTPLFGLPGNPVSVLVAFEQFARPALSKMMGRSRLYRPRSQGILAEPVSTDPAKTVFLRVTCDDDGSQVHLAGGQSSNVLSAAAMADAFAVVPVGTSSIAAGEPVTLEWFRRPASRTAAEATTP
jgi:molybdopterin molybdotransferase